MRKLNRKGFTYLITVSILAVIIIFVFLSSSRYTFQDKQEVYANRVILMDDFITDFNEDIHRATYISSFRSLLALEGYIATPPSIFFNDTEEAFKEAFFNGTIDGTFAPLLNDSSFSDYLLKINDIASQIGLASNIAVLNIELNQSTPWTIDVVVYTEVNVTDLKGVASWYFTQAYVTEVPIYDLRDPLYIVFTGFSNAVAKFDEPFLVNTSNNDTTNLLRFLNGSDYSAHPGSYYIPNPNAPSFLQRFENNLSAHPQGIESIVNVGVLSAQGIDVYNDRIKTDYIYFNDLAGGKLCEVDGVPESYYFVIPKNSAAFYEVDGLTYNNATCP